MPAYAQDPPAAAHRVIELTEEPYDGETAVALIAALLADLNVRYVAQGEGMTSDQLTDADARYLAHVTPALVTCPVGAFVVARVAGVPVGCGAVKPLSGIPEIAEVGEIKRMYTVPAGRRRGVGRAVLDRLEVIAVELGMTKLQLETGTEQPEAVALYASSGWQRVEPYGQYKDEPTSVCFAKALVPSWSALS